MGNIIFITALIVLMIIFLPSIMMMASDLAEMVVDGIVNFIQYIVDDWKGFLKAVFKNGGSEMD